MGLESYQTPGFSSGQTPINIKRYLKCIAGHSYQKVVSMADILAGSFRLN